MTDFKSHIHHGWFRRLPMVLQNEASECGLACLTMIAYHFGYRTDLAHLRRRFDVSLKGATLRDLVRIADEIGLSTRPLRLELSEMHQLRMPCILHWDLNHFVVLRAINRNSAIIHDPAAGLRRVSEAELARCFTGVALELTPTERFEPSAPPPRIKPFQLLGRVMGISRALAEVFAMALAIEVFALISPLFLSWVVDDAIVSGDRDLLLTLMLGFALLLLLQISISTMRGWVLMGLNASVKVQSRANLFSHLINLPVTYFESRHLGDVVSRFESQEAILDAFTGEVIEAVLDGLMAFLTLLIMYRLAPDLTILIVCGALVYAALRWISFKPLQQATTEELVWSARRDTHFLETLRGIRTIKIFNGQDERRVRWLNLLVEAINRNLTTQRLHILFRMVREILLGTLALVIIWLGARAVMDKALSVGLLLAFLAYKEQFLERVSGLIDRIADLKMLRVHAERLADIALTRPEMRSNSATAVREGGASVSAAPFGIEFRNVSFRYGDTEPWVLENVSFRISGGQSVAIVGPSGCGKTTLLKLLCGLLQPKSGEILVNNMPIAAVGLENYRNMLGIVLQDDSLFSGSIAENITFFSDRPDSDLMRHCADLAAIHDTISAMPMNYGTLIGDMGTVLSGGQKQRILLARALYRRPGLLLLDEATSHLDVDSERLVNKSISSLRLTRIIIAHRPETIRSADRILTLNNGRIVADDYTATNALQPFYPSKSKRGSRRR